MSPRSKKARTTVTREMVLLALHYLKVRFRVKEMFHYQAVAIIIAQLFPEVIGSRKQKDGPFDSLYDSVSKIVDDLSRDDIVGFNDGMVWVIQSLE